MGEKCTDNERHDDMEMPNYSKYGIFKSEINNLVLSRAENPYTERKSNNFIISICNDSSVQVVFSSTHLCF